MPKEWRVTIKEARPDGESIFGIPTEHKAWARQMAMVIWDGYNHEGTPYVQHWENGGWVDRERWSLDGWVTIE